MVGEETDYGRPDDETRIAEGEGCRERQAWRIDSTGSAEEQRNRVGDPEPTEDEADHGRNGLTDEENRTERDRNERGAEPKQPARADPLVDDVASSRAIAIPSENPVKASAAPAGLAPVLCLR